MNGTFTIAVRNLSRYQRRTILTVVIITFGVALVIVFSGFMNTFKANMVGAITGGVLGDIQVHSNGYVASIESLPLYMSMGEGDYTKLKTVLNDNTDIDSYTPRIKFGGMVSTYVKTSGLRITAVDPMTEMMVCKNLTERVSPSPDPEKGLLRNGEVIVPELIANGLALKLGDEVVLLANNKEGSINAITVKIAGFSGTITDPSGRDAYITIEDAANLLRLEKPEYSEVAIKLKEFDDLERAQKKLLRLLSVITDEDGDRVFEAHTWEQLSPVSAFIRIVDLLLIISKFILIVIVLISVMNVMIMSVYERVSEIGTIAAIGTIPSKILSIFLAEGVSMGVLGAIAGTALGMATNLVISLIKPTVVLGHMMRLEISPYVSVGDVSGACAIVLCIAALASLEPAVKASHMEVVDAMRHN